MGYKLDNQYSTNGLGKTAVLVGFIIKIVMNVHYNVFSFGGSIILSGFMAMILGFVFKTLAKLTKPERKDANKVYIE